MQFRGAERLLADVDAPSLHAPADPAEPSEVLPPVVAGPDLRPVHGELEAAKPTDARCGEEREVGERAA